MKKKETHSENTNQQDKGLTSEILDEISSQLSIQIQLELEDIEKNLKVEDHEDIPENRELISLESESTELGGLYEGTKNVNFKVKPSEKLKFSRKIGTIVLGICLIFGLSFLIKYSVQAGNMLNRINYIDDSEIEYAKTDITDETPISTKTPVPMEETEVLVDSDRVVNILLVGEENVYEDASFGRSDSMMIATINGKEKSLKLTSLMRDIYIQIPGYLPNKLNAAYNNGGGKLLTDTVEQNFGIPIDGYVVVNFQGLEDIINILGGVKVTLTEDEAYYLNTTNYIKKKQYRNVVAGTQILNGNQAVGYCRVRKRGASNGEHDDFGRTYRQRAVLSALFDSYKNKSVSEMLDLANELIPYISTNMKKAQLLDYITLAASLGTMELEQLRIPVDRTYYGMDVPCGHSIGDALTIDYDENIRIMKEFIYGKDYDHHDSLHASDVPTDSEEDGTQKDVSGYYDEYGNYHSKPSKNDGSVMVRDDYVPHFETYGYGY